MTWRRFTAEGGIFYGETTTAEDTGFWTAKWRRMSSIASSGRCEVCENTDYTASRLLAAVDIPTRRAKRDFAYSPMGQTKSTSGDLGYPSGTQPPRKARRSPGILLPPVGLEFYNGHPQLGRDDRKLRMRTDAPRCTKIPAEGAPLRPTA